MTNWHWSKAAFNDILPQPVVVVSCVCGHVPKEETYSKNKTKTKCTSSRVLRKFCGLVAGRGGAIWHMKGNSKGRGWRRGWGGGGVGGYT